MKIDLIEISRRFSHVWALRNVTTGFESSRIYAVLGANGAGKSTLLSLLAGWLPVSSGKILIDGSPLRPTSPRLRRSLFLLRESNGPQTTQIPLQVVARDIADFRADRQNIEAEVADWCERLEVISVATQDVKKMSKGQAYKLAMIGLFVIAPPVWLLDEPFSAGLDAAGLMALESEIRQHATRGGIVIFSSQWPEHAKRMADQALVLHEGSLVWTGAPKVAPPVAIVAGAPSSLSAVLQGLG